MDEVEVKVRVDPAGFVEDGYNAGMRGSKGTIYDGGHRVPFVARWPGHIKPGTTSDFLTMFQDFLPTAAELVMGRAPTDAPWAALACDPPAKRSSR